MGPRCRRKPSPLTEPIPLPLTASVRNEKRNGHFPAHNGLKQSDIERLSVDGNDLHALGLWFIWRVLNLASKYNPVENPSEEVGDINVREPVPQRPKGPKRSSCD
jgi:hypothetical protein